jgi:hypothetical protein
MGVAIPIPRAGERGDSERRLKRLRALAWFLDRSIPIGRWRIGLDPILGLLPGVGDFVGAVLSLYILYEAARLGTPAHLLARMGGNILVEALAGTIPVVGDLFDFAWQANARNLALIERHHHTAVRPRSSGKMWFMLAVVCVVILATVAGLVFLFAKVLNSLLATTGGTS